MLLLSSCRFTIVYYYCTRDKKMMTTAEKKNERALDDFLARLLQGAASSDSDDDSCCYLLLIQHSRSLALRVMTEEQQQQQNAAVYRRAKLRTPHENARRDWQAGALWLEHVIGRLLGQQKSPEEASSHSSRLILLQTNPTTTALAEISERIETINLAVDPWGWDDDDDDDDDSVCSPSSDAAAAAVNLNNLGAIVQAVQNALSKIQQQQQQAQGSSETTYSTPIVLDSLGPLLMRHGFGKTLQFIRTLLLCHLPQKKEEGFLRRLVVGPVLVPVQVDGRLLTTRQHQMLEDLASAVLCLNHGQATLVRQGVREKDNLVQSLLPYEIVVVAAANDDDDATKTGGGRSTTMIRVLSRDAAPGPPLESFIEEKDPQHVANHHRTRNTPTPTTTTTTSSIKPNSGSMKTDRRAKIQLELEQDGAPPKPNHILSSGTSTAKATTLPPRIFLQDDDPEYDDYDEEDPDDDLDI